MIDHLRFDADLRALKQARQEVADASVALMGAERRLERAKAAEAVADADMQNFISLAIALT